MHSVSKHMCHGVLLQFHIQSAFMTWRIARFPCDCTVLVVSVALCSQPANNDVYSVMYIIVCPNTLYGTKYKIYVRLHAASDLIFCPIQCIAWDDYT